MPRAQHSTALRRFTVGAAESGKRLDVYLALQLPELSRTRIQELIRDGSVRIGAQPSRAARHVESGETIEIEVSPRPPLSAKPEDIPIELLYENADLVVVNKPAGMIVHAGAGAHSGTMVNALLHRLGSLSNEGGVRPGIVHRLDRGTSGVLVVARNDAAHRDLAAQFKSRTVRKMYIALAHGKFAKDSGVIELPIARDPHRRTRMTARLKTGREARTSWRALLRFANFTLVAAQLHTGRTHQIRAHFAAIGHPLVGDTLYGAPERARADNQLLPPLGRVFLHAAQIGFKAPGSGREIQVTAKLDPDLKKYMDQIAKLTKLPTAQVDAALKGYL